MRPTQISVIHFGDYSKNRINELSPAPYFAEAIAVTIRPVETDNPRHPDEHSLTKRSHIMARVQVIDPRTATGPAKELLDAVQAQLGVTPNFIRVLANSPKALEGFLGLYGALGGFSLDKATQERIALAVAESNGCQYCVSAHTAIGRGAGLSNEEMALNRHGRSAADARVAGAVSLAKALNDNLGEITSAEVDAARAAGLDDGEIVEVIAVVALNVFTNLLGKATRVEIDFPKVELMGSLKAAA
jgi:uncharacterized peroxidase-related enzyme